MMELMLLESSERSMRVKNPANISVVGLKDSKSLWESLHTTQQCEEKLLRNSISGMKELLEENVVRDVTWVPTDAQIADCLTKKNAKAD